jgi:hypothetical protein
LGVAWALFVSLLTFSAAGAALAADGSSGFRSGVYEGLTLAVDGTGLITGYYREVQGEGVTKSCAFFLKGQARGGDAEVSTWSDRIRPGQLVARPDGVQLRIENGRQHAGCGLVLMPQIAEGLDLDLVENAEWIELRTVASERAYFHSARDASSRLRAFVVRGDVVGVLSRSGEWLRAEYRGSKRTTGWIRASDTLKVDPPTK